jgi:uncharacterized protein YrrD
MTGAEVFLKIDSIIGQTVISRATGNKLGNIADAIIDPIDGLLLGFAADTGDGVMQIVTYHEVFSVGPDAVMVNTDDSLTDVESSELSSFPLAKRDLTGANVITDTGTLLGPIASVYVSQIGAPAVVYELRDSIFDKLLGRSLFIPAAAGQALSDDAARLIVPHEVAENPADNLEVYAEQVDGTHEEVVMRTLRDSVRTPNEIEGAPPQIPAQADTNLIGRGATAGADDVTVVERLNNKP